MIKNEEYLSKLHSNILLVMDEIDRVCKRNNLRYYLIGGTLLGAIRHGGFIPWDDDLDIVMPREDMEKFIELTQTELSNEFYLDWITTNKCYCSIFPKVCLRNTLFEERINRKGSFPGIFVDIFPLDFSGGYCEDLESYKYRLKRLHYISTSKLSLKKDIKTIFYKLMGFLISNELSYKLQRRTCLQSASYGRTHYTNYGSQYSVEKQTMPIEWFGDGVYVGFEDRKYMAPIEYKKVLNSIFGSSYMELPPVEKRRSHYPKRVIFNDGTCMEFEKPEHVVTIDEQ